jgi:hypothetical protein
MMRSNDERRRAVDAAPFFYLLLIVAGIAAAVRSGTFVSRNAGPAMFAPGL